MTRQRSLIAFFFLYALLDFASPMSPGPFQLQPGESTATEELWTVRRTNDPVVVRASWRPVGIVAKQAPRQATSQGQRRQAPAKIILPVGRAHLPASPDSGSPSDDPSTPRLRA